MNLTYSIKPCRAVFTRRGYQVELFRDGKPFIPWLPVYDTLNMRSQRTRFAPCPMPVTFFGNDGRKVRSEAVRWAKEQIRYQTGE